MQDTHTQAASQWVVCFKTIQKVQHHDYNQLANLSMSDEDDPSGIVLYLLLLSLHVQPAGAVGSPGSEACLCVLQ